MTRRVLIRAAAEKDLDDAHTWYNGQRPGLGDEFLVSIAEAFTRLELLLSFSGLVRRRCAWRTNPEKEDVRVGR